MEELNRNRDRRLQRLDASEINSLSITDVKEIEEANEKAGKRIEKIAQRKAKLEANSLSYKASISLLTNITWIQYWGYLYLELEMS